MRIQTWCFEVESAIIYVLFYLTHQKLAHLVGFRVRTEESVADELDDDDGDDDSNLELPNFVGQSNHYLKFHVSAAFAHRFHPLVQKCTEAESATKNFSSTLVNTEAK